jgi:hypothetical protein
MPHKGRGKPRALRVPITDELTPKLDPYMLNPATPYFIKYAICTDDQINSPKRMYFFQLTCHEHPEGNLLCS